AATSAPTRTRATLRVIANRRRRRTRAEGRRGAVGWGADIAAQPRAARRSARRNRRADGAARAPRAPPCGGGTPCLSLRYGSALFDRATRNYAPLTWAFPQRPIRCRNRC